MSYPMLANWVGFKRLNGNEYMVKDFATDSEFKLDAYSVWFAKQLNGKRNPYLIDKHLSRGFVDELLKELDDNNIIRDKRFLSKSIFYLLITLWRPRTTKATRIVSFFANALLLTSHLPLLFFAAYYFIENMLYCNFECMLAGHFLGMFTGMVLHEIGHMIACLANGGRVFELGVLMQFFLPGAYVMMDDKPIKRRSGRIQVIAAGIEMNILLTAIFLILSARFSDLSGFFLGAAINNAIMAVVNLIFADGLDGMAIMGELLGVKGIVGKARRIVRSNFKRQQLSKQGISGKATIVACYIIKLIQIGMPLILGLNITGVIACFL